MRGVWTNVRPLESFKEHKLSEDKDEELKYKGTD